MELCYHSFFFLAGQYINIITLINTLDYVNI